MFSSEFEKYFESVKQYFGGVFPFDKIPKRLKQEHFIICNTGDSNSEGEHWFVLYRSDSYLIEVFDSLGINEEKLNKLKELKFQHVRKLNFNVTPVQSNESNNCGEYCIYFVYQRLFNKDLDFNMLMNEIFSYNLTENAKMVESFINENLL